MWAVLKCFELMVLHSFDPHSSELVGKRVCKNVEQPAKKPFLNVVVVSISSQFSQVLSLVLPHIERRCGRNGLKLGRQDTKNLFANPLWYTSLIPSPSQGDISVPFCAILPSLRNEEREDLAIIQQLSAACC